MKWKQNLFKIWKKYYDAMEYEKISYEGKIYSKYEKH